MIFTQMHPSRQISYTKYSTPLILRYVAKASFYDILKHRSIISHLVHLIEELERVVFSLIIKVKLQFSASSSWRSLRKQQTQKKNSFSVKQGDSWAARHQNRWSGYQERYRRSWCPGNSGGNTPQRRLPPEESKQRKRKHSDKKQRSEAEFICKTTKFPVRWLVLKKTKEMEGIEVL